MVCAVVTWLRIAFRNGYLVGAYVGSLVGYAVGKLVGPLVGSLVGPRPIFDPFVVDLVGATSDRWWVTLSGNW
jgi:hypothetical protein